MTLGERVFAQAALLAGELDGKQTALLHTLCAASAASLAARLKEGLTPEDCQEDFLTAASLLALASLSSAEETGQIQEFKAGDLTIRQGGTAGSTPAQCLRQQARLLMAPYLRDSFSFAGV